MLSPLAFLFSITILDWTNKMMYLDLYPIPVHNYAEDYFYTSHRNTLSKAANLAGRTTGKVKNFFSKTETKTSVLISYWAADTLVAALLLLTAFSFPILFLVGSLVAIHTYATFSVISEVYS